MAKISSDDVKDYLLAGGKFVASLALKFYGDSMNQAGETAFSDAIEIGIVNTIAALYDVDTKDDEIISLLNKFWGINQSEAEERLLFEKRQSVFRTLRHHLKMKGYSDNEIRDFIVSNNVVAKINHSNAFWQLRHSPDKLMKEIQTNR